ncbi:transporter [Desulfopila sp. IMCC35006]|uniref:OmpP1/FadL family transporter n=1 Tax=Desulfopila sp. IMCC35006 TaxID=2569542 RepID=UPI0010AB75F0|nr:OmpP1/FadL family transporter [Desulfopila sp. IMCC35006]TKB26970.1 transporter [Desulfopila sp. IMCC35006]
MKKKISVLALVSLFAAGSAMASGWRIPEQSVDSTAKAGANIASSTRADTAYYNPANMAWMADTWHLEADATWIHLTEIDYADSRSPIYNGSSEAENFFVPTGFVVTPSYGGARFGLAITAPAGLSKQWKDPYPRTFAEEFTLEVIEVNPTVSYSFGDMVSIAAGPRMLYAKATVTSNGMVTLPSPPYPAGTRAPLGRDMDGDTTEWGWNVALAVKPVEKLNISATYRSKVDLDFEDEATLIQPGRATGTFPAEVSVPVPAVFALSVAYDVLPKLNVELTWDRTFWSTYDKLDFNFTPPAVAAFEDPIPKDWDDSNAFRIGLTYTLTDYLTLMGGFAYDQTPVPTENIGFELPDSNAWIYSLGAQYAVTDKMDIGIAALYDYKESRTAKSADGKIDGEFTDAAAFLITVGLNYRF